MYRGGPRKSCMHTRIGQHPNKLPYVPANRDRCNTCSHIDRLCAAKQHAKKVSVSGCTARRQKTDGDRGEEYRSSTSSSSSPVYIGLENLQSDITNR
jgi:hypothetical protein